MTIDDGEPLVLLITNLSRGGFRVEPTAKLPAARQVTIHVEGWPPLTGRTVWSKAGMTGCIFDPKPSGDLYAGMLKRTEGDDRAG